MKRFEEGFPDTLNGMNFKTLEESKHSIYALSEALNLLYVNPSWVDFAKKNGAIDRILKQFPIGTNITNVFLGDLVKNFYKQNYLNVLITGKPWRNQYECSSVNEYREFHQDVYPLKNLKGLIIVNTLTVHLPMEQKGRKVYKISDKRYVNTAGFVTQCSNCRCNQRVNEPEIWDWVPEWVEKLPKNCSHSICPTCFDYYWKV